METECCGYYLGIVCLKLGQDAILKKDSENRVAISVTEA
jgi:hypothetical protein